MWRLGWPCSTIHRLEREGEAAARFSIALSKPSVVSFFYLFLLSQKQSNKGGTIEVQ
jgi:hypothetical protein